jgi:hypothetical protein
LDGDTSRRLNSGVAEYGGILSGETGNTIIRVIVEEVVGAIRKADRGEAG